ncbi:hypothetical protein DSLASN_27890 [Desulfoluna limicola]|uniref:Uncharacterized protein n=1 Tax=Desulfoluna limicola TaxID=2810562 RepID=A0ABM7PHU8_9BACT|nr:hypothetical protein [Desulfoluna limicola]BCS97157.1 hypothetical protein DSLASN_27890 [Desulfoluna limicola]
MKRLLIFIVGAFFLATTVVAVAAEKPVPFSPKIHNEANLPEGILYVDSGTVNFVETQRVVVDDAEYPYNKKMQVFTMDGLKGSKKSVKKGKKVDVYANDKHEAVYIVIK